MKAFIRSVGSYVPTHRISNDELAKSLDTSDEWIFSHTGIHSRHVAADDETASDMAVYAAQQALDTAGVDGEALDLILVATSTPDFYGFPSTAAIVQDALGAHNAGAMDVAAACTGFIYALETARAFIESRAAMRILVIGSEVMSRILDWSDRNTCVLFGDGAGAALVTANEGHENSEVEHGILRSQGSGAEHLKVHGAGSRKRVDVPKVDHPFVHMNGRKVYSFAVKALCDTAKMLLEMNSVSLDEIAYIVPHQANARIIEAAGKRMRIPREKFYTNMAEYANTSAASIPLALAEMTRKNLLERGQIIMTIGFGGGLTYGGNLIRW